MITLYELKQNTCFRCCYKSPYYIKNLFLMLTLAVLLLIIYVIYFRADGGSLESIMKIMKGLNSNTFNYLETHQDKLKIREKIPEYIIHKGDRNIKDETPLS